MLGLNARIYMQQADNELPLPTTIVKNKPTLETDPRYQNLNDAIKLSRYCIATLVVVVAITITVVLYITLSNDEVYRFESAYNSAILEIEDSVASNIKIKLTSAVELASVYSSLKLSLNSWPNTTYIGFTSLASQLCSKKLNCLSISFSPIVQSEQNSGWEAYALNDLDDWKVSEGLPLNYNVSSWRSAGGIYKLNSNGLNMYHNSSTEYNYSLPLWQTYPYVAYSSSILFNFMSDALLKVDLNYVVQQKSPRITHIGPFSAVLTTPIIDITETFTLGIISILFNVSSLLETYVGFDCATIDSVIGTPFGIVTYSITRDSVTVKSVGVDSHDVSFNQYGYSLQLLDSSNSLNISSMHISLYPTMHLKDKYITNMPLVLGSCLGAAILFIGMLFTFYDYLLNKRTHSLLGKVTDASTVVDELFPTVFRDQLFEHRRRSRSNQSRRSLEGEDRRSMDDSSAMETYDGMLSRDSNDICSADEIAPPPVMGRSLQQLAETMKARASPIITNGVKRLIPYLAQEIGPTEVVADISSEPIAKQYLHATVLFADVAGFTKWSSSRSPVEVFDLLEGLFGLFDAAAERRGIFKVETIGDCYMAVSGIPDETNDHATRMAEFGLDILEAMEQLHAIKGMIFMDGLQIRVGMHSGAVTAGVLRGAKSRFQLFGDTVNTASRMESSSFPSCVHMSSSTVGYLRLEGAPHRIQRRKVTIVAKGIGEMQTFWLLGRIQLVGEEVERFLIEEDERIFLKTTPGREEVAGIRPSLSKEEEEEFKA